MLLQMLKAKYAVMFLFKENNIREKRNQRFRYHRLGYIPLLL